MPEIQKAKIANGKLPFLKPVKMGLKRSDELDAVIQAPHQTSPKGLESVQVKTSSGVIGMLSLNASNKNVVIDALGTNSDTWIGARIEGIVIEVTNPTSGERTLGWSFLKVTPAGKEASKRNKA